MVISILQNSQSFNGIFYSEDKLERGVAQLMSSHNIPSGIDTQNEILKYLDQVSSLNPKVKNVQFHASISTEGTNHSFEELENVAKEYLQKMGYDNSAYLIYSHDDSPNNHVHIVATRVDKNGNKVSDSLERGRTQEFILKNLKVDFSKNVSQTINASLNFNFKNTKALQAVLFQQGYKTRLVDGNLQVIKSGKVQATISKKKIKDKKFFSKIDFDNQQQIKAWIAKYSTSSDFNSLKKNMHEKFGLEIIYSYTTDQSKKNQENRKRIVNDYNLIDHKKKEVYNSVELIPLKIIKELFEKITIKKDLAKDIAKDIFDIKQDPKTYFETKNSFKDQGNNLDSKGNITSKEGNVIGTLDKNTMNKLFYNQRLADLNKAVYTPSINETTLAHIFKVKPADVSLESKILSPTELERYSDYVNSYLSRNKDNPKDSNDIKIYSHHSGAILIDKTTSTILNIDKDLNIKIEKSKLENIQSLKQERNPEFARDQYPLLENSSSKSILDSILNIDVSDNGTDEKRKKKRKRNQQQNM